MHPLCGRFVQFGEWNGCSVPILFSWDVLNCIWGYFRVCAVRGRELRWPHWDVGVRGLPNRLFLARWGRHLHCQRRVR